MRNAFLKTSTPNAAFYLLRNQVIAGGIPDQKEHQMELIEATIRKFGETVGVPDLKLDSENICSLVVDDEIEVFFQVLDFKSNVIRLNSPVADLSDVQNSVHELLLEANYNGIGTGAAALSIDPHTSEVLLTQPLQVDKLSENEFEEAVTMFVKYTSFWVQELADIAKLPFGDPASAPAIDSGLERTFV